MDFEREEIPRHRKKKEKKSPKKADHQHNYVPVKIKQNPFAHYVRSFSEENKRYWVFYDEKCTICGKERFGSLTLKEDEYHAFIQEVRKNNGYIEKGENND